MPAWRMPKPILSAALPPALREGLAFSAGPPKHISRGYAADLLNPAESFSTRTYCWTSREIALVFEPLNTIAILQINTTLFIALARRSFITPELTPANTIAGTPPAKSVLLLESNTGQEYLT